MRYVISDIHGNKTAWENIKKKINLQFDDTLYILGDVVDRGEYGIEILQEIMNSSNMQMILGNHEYMMLSAFGCSYDGVYNDRALELWYMNGGEVTNNHMSRLPARDQIDIIQYLIDCPLNIHIDDIILCHAAPEELWENLGMPLGYQTKEEFCVWSREAVNELKASAIEQKIIFGHTPTIYLNDHNDPMSIYNYADKLYGIDCGSGFPTHHRGKPTGAGLACLNLDTWEEYYVKKIS